MTSNKNVSALAWNRKNHDLLAVGYGPFEYNDQRDGLVCCWSIKNQEVKAEDLLVTLFLIFFNRFSFLNDTSTRLLA